MTARYNHHKFDQEKRRNSTAWENWVLELVGEHKAGAKVVLLRPA